MKLYLSLNANPAAITSTPFLSFPSKSNNQFFLLKSPTSVSFSTKPSPSFIPLCSSNRFAIPNLKISSLEANGLPQTSKFSLGEESNQNYNVGVGKPVLPIFIFIFPLQSSSWLNNFELNIQTLECVPQSVIVADNQVTTCMLQGRYVDVLSLECRKSCRLRWLNYLRPNIKRGTFAEDEIQLIIKLHKLLGNKWSLIAGRLPGRTANDVKNYWNCHLSKKLNNAQETEEEDQNGMKMETLKPQPRCIAMTGSMKPRTRDHFAPKNQPTMQESTMPTPFNLVEVDKQQGQEVVKEEEDIREEGAGGVLFGDLATDDHQFGQLDEVNVLSSTDEGCSKWDWDNLMLDIDLWTDSL